MATSRLKRLPRPLRGERNADGSRTLAARDTAELRSTLGDDLLAAFACAFAISNRHAALVQLAKLSQSPGFDGSQTRNRFTIFFFSIGVAHEAVAALDRLTKELRAAKCLKTVEATNHRELREIAKRWREHLPNRLRNKWAFHFDEDCFRAGVARWPSMEDVTLLLVDSENRETYFPFADDLLLTGTAEVLEQDLDGDIVSEIARDLWKDQNAFSARVFNVFCEALGELAEKNDGP